MPAPTLDGTGEARRAIDVFREPEPATGDLAFELSEEFVRGTGRGRDLGGTSSLSPMVQEMLWREPLE